MLHGSCWTRPRGPRWVDDFSCKVTLTQWIRNQVTGSGFIRWLQPSWQTARWAGRTNGHWFFNKGPEAVSQPGYGDIFSRGDGLLPMMAWLAPDHGPPHRHSLHLQLHTSPWPYPHAPTLVLIGINLKCCWSYKAKHGHLHRHRCWLVCWWKCYTCQYDVIPVLVFTHDCSVLFICSLSFQLTCITQ